MKILLTETNHNPETPILLTKAGHEVFIPKQEIPNVHEFDRTALIQTIKDLQPDVLVVGLKFDINREVMESAPLKAIFTRTTNITDHIDIYWAKEHGIDIINLKGEDLEDVTAVAEACLGAMIQLSRLDKSEIRGKTLGLWGYGRIAKHLEKYAKVHDMNIIAYDTKFRDTENQSNAGLLDVLLESSDYISLHASSTPENKEMVNYEHFKKMKQRPYFINSARHWMTRGVFWALKEELIKGYWTDLPIDFEHPRAIIWSHSGSTLESSLKTEKIITEKIIAWSKS